MAKGDGKRGWTSAEHVEIYNQGYEDGYTPSCKDVKTEQQKLPLTKTIAERYGCSENPCRDHGDTGRRGGW